MDISPKILTLSDGQEKEHKEKSERHIKEVENMLTEEQKRKIENLYNDYYEMAYNTETREDMKSFFMGKYLAIEEVLRHLGYSLKKEFKIE